MDSRCNILKLAAFGAVLLTFQLTVTLATPPTDADCTGPDPFADPDNCTCYYQCFDVGTGYTLVHLDCPAGGYWDDTYKSCVAGDCPVVTTPTEPTTTTIPTTIETTSVTTPASSASTASSPGSTAPPGSTPSGATTPAVSPSTTQSSSSSPAPSTGPTTPAPTSGPPTFTCTSSGYFAHPTDPTKYYRCVLIGAQFYYYIYSCPPNSCFQQAANTCVVGTCDNAVTTAAPPGGGNNGTTPPSVTSPPVDIICNGPGQHPFPGSCTKYYNCVLLSDGFVYYVFECPPSSYFNQATQLCTVGTCPATSVTTVGTTPSTTKAAVTTTTPKPDYPCPNQGYFSDPADCNSYYRCILISGQMYRYMYHCPVGAYWNQAQQGCIVGTCPA